MTNPAAIALTTAPELDPRPPRPPRQPRNQAAPSSHDAPPPHARPQGPARTPVPPSLEPLEAPGAMPGVATTRVSRARATPHPPRGCSREERARRRGPPSPAWRGVARKWLSPRGSRPDPPAGFQRGVAAQVAWLAATRTA